jgi:hypothetical protein
MKALITRSYKRGFLTLGHETLKTLGLEPQHINAI